MSACPGCGLEDGHEDGCPEAPLEEFVAQTTSEPEPEEEDADGA